jgi:hypothetical protein
MRTSRRIFIRNLGLTSAGIFAPSLFLKSAYALAGTRDSAQMNSGFKIVENGAARAVIVVASSTSSTSSTPQFAAQELQRHIEKATNVKLAIVSEQGVAASTLPHRIYTGMGEAAKKAGLRADDLPANGFRSKTTNDAIYFAGKDDRGRPDDPAFGSGRWPDFKSGELPLDDTVSMGTLFAVYDWLENQLSARWLWPDETGLVVRKTATLFSGAAHEKAGLPTLLFAQARLNTWAGMDPKRLPQYVYDTSLWMRRQRLARGQAIPGAGHGHAFGTYWKRFGATHPEYFAMLPNGKREPFNPKRPNLVQMCVSNAGFRRQVIADWLEKRKKDPSLHTISASENDRTAMDPPCQCEFCHAWDPKNPQPPLVPENPWLSGNAQARNKDWKQISVSDRYAKFWLAVQKEAQQYDPDVVVFSHAYTDYSDPPVETKLNKNIVVGIVPAYAYPMSPQEEAEFQKVWDGWEATGATLYLRPNNFLTGYDLPQMYPTQFGYDFKHALQNGMIGTDFDSLVGMWGIQGINLYMMGRLTAHPEMSVDEVLNEYYSAFGAASGDIQKYFEFWEKVTAQITTEFRKNAGGGWSPLSREGDVIYTPETFTRGKELLQKAKLSVGADSEVLARIDYLSMWLEHANLTINVLTAFKSYKAKPTDAPLKTSFESAKTALDNYREAHADKIVNIGFLHYLETWWRNWKAPANAQ